MKRWLLYGLLIACFCFFPFRAEAITSVGTTTLIGTTLQVVGSTSGADGIAIRQEVGAYSHMSVQTQGTWAGIATIEGSNDGVIYYPIIVVPSSSTGGGGVSTISTLGVWHGPVAWRYVQIRFSTATSGTLAVTVDFKSASSSWQVRGGGGSGGGGTCTGSVVSQWSSYNGINTVSNGVPAEYATVDLTAQTAAISSTLLYAVPSTGVGMYRISFIAKVTTPGTTSTLGGSTGFQIIYTDSSDSVAVTTPVGTTSATNTTQAIIQGSIIIYAKAQTNINYSLGYTSSGTAMQYNLHVKLEAL